MKKKLVVSFSGGRTSAYMLWWILNNWADKYEIKVVFANTGKEHEGTLKFVNDCSTNFNVDVIWVEGYPDSEKGWKVKAKVVTYETASRNGEPFEAMIAKLGIPSTNAPFCSDQLKRLTIEDYMRQIGWKRYYKAIGVRADELDRIKTNWRKLRILYPLVHLGTLKRDVIIFFSRMPFDLVIPKNLGNCDGCWKKSFEDLTDIARNDPKVFDWWQLMTDKYSYLNPRNTELEPPFNFYRSNKSPVDIIEMAERPYTELELFPDFKTQADCGDSCEAFR
jgi:hypothetical protein